MLVPLQAAATSYAPAAARHTAPAFPAGCVQVLVLPSHWSSVQGLVSAVQAVPAGCLASVGQVVLVAVHPSVTPPSAHAAWRTVPALPAGCWQVALAPSDRSRAQGLVS